MLKTILNVIQSINQKYSSILSVFFFFFKEFCNQNGGHLVQVDSVEEANFIRTKIKLVERPDYGLYIVSLSLSLSLSLSEESSSWFITCQFTFHGFVL